MGAKVFGTPADKEKNMIDLNRNLPKEYDGYRGRDLALRYLQLNGIKTKEQPKLWKDRVAEAEAKKKRYHQERLFEVQRGYEKRLTNRNNYLTRPRGCRIYARTFYVGNVRCTVR